MVLVILAFWAGWGSFQPDPAEAQHQVYFPLIFNGYCSKDLVFLAFGDSITTCFMDSAMCAYPQCGYPKRLYDRLKARFNRDFAFYNVGWEGERTLHGLYRMEDTINRPEAYNISPSFCPDAPGNFYPAASTNIEPDLVIIMEGINDVGDWAAREFPSLETIQAHIRDMALTALQTGKHVILATLTPVVPINDHRELQGQGVAVLNNGIRQIAADYQIPLADIYAFFVNYPNWAGELMSTALKDDGLHPNDLGFAVMAEAFYQTILTHVTATGCYN
jgi:hypothetical protein